METNTNGKTSDSTQRKLHKSKVLKQQPYGIIRLVHSNRIGVNTTHFQLFVVDENSVPTS